MTVKLKFFVLFVLCLTGCSNEAELPAGLRAGSFKMADESEQEKVLAEMRRQSIPYMIDESDFVWFMQEDVAEVRKLRREIHIVGQESLYNLDFVFPIDSRDLALYKRKLDKQSVPYQVKNENGQYRIEIDSSYADIVDQIVEDVGFEFFYSSIHN